MRARTSLAVLVAASAFCFPVVVGSHAGLGPVGVALADSARLKVGDVVPPKQIKLIDSPGRYGLGREPRDSKYAIVGGKLVRINPKTGKILSILRQQAEPLD